MGYCGHFLGRGKMQMDVHISLFRRTMLATTFLVVPAAAFVASPAMAQCAASSGTVAVPANGATVTCYSGLTSTTRIGDGSTSATVALEDNHFLDRSAGGYGVYLNTATITLGTGAVIQGGAVGGNTGVYTLGAVDITLGLNAQVNGRYGIWSNGGNSVIDLGDGAQVNSNQQSIFTGAGNVSVTLGDGAQVTSAAQTAVFSSAGDSVITLGDGAQINSGTGQGIYQNGNPVITLGAGAQINAGTVGINNSFGALNRKVTLTLGTNAQINAGSIGVNAKYADIALQNGAQINAGTVGISMGLGGGPSLITLAPGSSIVSAAGQGILGNSGAADTVDSAGLIQGVGNAIDLRGGDDVLTLRTGSQIVGNVEAGVGNDTLNLFGTATEDANFLGFETFNMNGTDWTLTGNSVLGVASLNSGILRNNGNITANVTVNAGATFGGTGNTTGSLANSGTVAPGDVGTGTMTVTGGFTQAAGGSLEIGIGPVTSDLLDVTGAATLDGNLHVTQTVAGTIADGAVYTVLQAGGGVGGAFGSVTDDLFFVDFTPTFNPGNVQITASRSLAAAGNTLTERRLAQVLEQAIVAGDPGTAAIDALLNTVTTQQQASNVLASQSGLVHSSAMRAGMGSIGQLARGVLTDASRPPEYEHNGPWPSPIYLERNASDDAAALSNIAPAAGGGESVRRRSPPQVWMRGTGSFGSVSGNATARGGDYYGGGLTVGAEHTNDPESRTGLYASASRLYSGIDGLADEATTDTYLLGVYGILQPAPRWAFRGALSGGWIDAETLRPTPGGPATAEFNGYGAYGYLETALTMHRSRNAYFAPVAGLEGAIFGNEAYRESGAGAFNLSVDNSTSAQLKTLMGAELAVSGQTDEGPLLQALDISTNLKALWTHEYLDSYPGTSASFVGAPTTAFNNPGPRMKRDALRLNGSVTATPFLDDHMEFYASYHLDLQDDASDNRVSGGFRIRW